ncbi:MAG: DegV family protein [Candidatus Aenigmarchaeota archaeon]|nr:DegV family protein [Candidatus Aenigmarchaeota archaeon]
MFGIVTDITCDLPKEFFLKNDVKVVPLYIIDGEKRIRVDLSYDFNNFFDDEELHKKWMAGKLRTSQPTVKDFVDAIKNVEENEVLVITLSSKLSGTYNVAKMASKIVKEKRVVVYDSMTTSAAMGFIVEHVVKLRDENFTVDECLSRIKGLNPEVFFMLKDVGFLFRSGRINVIKYGFLKLTKLSPILTVNDGEVKPYKLVKNSDEELVNLSKEFKRKVWLWNTERFTKGKSLRINPIISVNIGECYGFAGIKN